MHETRQNNNSPMSAPLVVNFVLTLRDPLYSDTAMTHREKHVL